LTPGNFRCLSTEPTRPRTRCCWTRRSERSDRCRRIRLLRGTLPDSGWPDDAVGI